MRKDTALTILENLSLPVLVIDRTYNVVFANSALSDHLKVPVGRLIGEPCYKVTHGTDVPCHGDPDITCPAKHAFHNNERAHAVHQHLLKGKYTVEEIIATPLDNGKYVVEEFRDISQLLGLIDGYLPICASCKRIRDDEGNWHQIEGYIHRHAGVDFSHSICQECMERLYPEYLSKKKDGE